MRKLMRMHRQTLLTDDMSDSIASHSYRVAIIGWYLAKMEKADLYKTMMMCLLHDMAEARTGDHNWVHKRYVKIFDEEIHRDQFGTLPFPDFKDLIDEYEERKTKEAILAKDADILDQVLLLREYDWQGNKEAKLWLEGRFQAKPIARLKSKTAKELGSELMKVDPSHWWVGLSTPVNRKK